MPLRIGKHKCEDFAECVKYVKKEFPGVKNPEGYVGAIYKNEKRHK